MSNASAAAVAALPAEDSSGGTVRNAAATDRPHRVPPTSQGSQATGSVRGVFAVPPAEQHALDAARRRLSAAVAGSPRKAADGGHGRGRGRGRGRCHRGRGKEEGEHRAADEGDRGGETVWVAAMCKVMVLTAFTGAARPLTSKGRASTRPLPAGSGQVVESHSSSTTPSRRDTTSSWVPE